MNLGIFQAEECIHATHKLSEGIGMTGRVCNPEKGNIVIRQSKQLFEIYAIARVRVTGSSLFENVM